MRTLYAAILVGSLIILAPALVIGGGFIIAGGLIVLLILVVVGSKLGFEVFKERQSGMSAAKARQRSTSDDGQSWRER